MPQLLRHFRIGFTQDSAEFKIDTNNSEFLVPQNNVRIITALIQTCQRNLNP